MALCLAEFDMLLVIEGIKDANYPKESQGFNRYTYANNNPLKYKDPSGEFFVIDSWIIGFLTDFSALDLADGVQDGMKQITGHIWI